MNNNFRQTLFSQSSETLAGIKPSNLFSTAKTFADDKYLLNILHNNNIEVKVLNENKLSSLILIYNRELLTKILEDNEVKEILWEFGYKNFSCEKILNKLSQKFNSDSFPHEIGLLLGYPPEDVKSFIKNEGKECKHCKLWKVYSKEDSARFKMNEYYKCRECFKNLYKKNSDVSKIIKYYKNEKVKYDFLNDFNGIY
ncbi:MAG: DUF3793 family protein [Peptoniphilaceae bacterium]|nr:DUF3793 family protein [Peptoniphilaceae bacterium]MDD7383911.1 DUF3793 family protein [Peptoniphilaceae bacterium]MDY3738054.1 DUF3793 family protein [Peptoniphilaceae bacterium]